VPIAEIVEVIITSTAVVEIGRDVDGRDRRPGGVAADEAVPAGRGPAARQAALHVAVVVTEFLADHEGVRQAVRHVRNLDRRPQPGEHTAHPLEAVRPGAGPRAARVIGPGVVGVSLVGAGVVALVGPRGQLRRRRAIADAVAAVAILLVGIFQTARRPGPALRPVRGYVIAEV